MTLYSIDPFLDPRWRRLVDQHPLSSIFHTIPWLKSLEDAYGYTPVVFTTSPPGEYLQNGIVFCKVKSWITGQRLVSLPFSDHCDPLCRTTDECDLLLDNIRDISAGTDIKYVEIRPTTEPVEEKTTSFKCSSTQRYVLHRMSLDRDVNDIFGSLDKDSIRRRISRAERAQLTEECGRSEQLLKDFYRLLIITRRRHHVPPQPFAWFQNLARHFEDALEIRMAYKERTPIAAILTLRFRDTVYYKYGCSDTAFNNLGATPLLLWKAIVQAKSFGAMQFDWGRTDVDNAGLIAFKSKWGSKLETLTYFRFSDSPLGRGDAWKVRFLKRAFAWMPPRLLEATGTLIYRHIG